MLVCTDDESSEARMERMRATRGARNRIHGSGPGALSLALMLTLVACNGSDRQPRPPAMADPPPVSDGGAMGAAEPACPAAARIASGAVDQHCMTDTGRPIRQHVARCRKVSDDEPPAAVMHDLSAEPPLFNGEGGDDDCKYEARLRITQDCSNASPTLELALARAVDQTPVLDAKPSAALARADDPSLARILNAVELPGGRYRFSAPIVERGRWAVRIRLLEECAYDDQSSPRGQVAFAIDIP